MEKTILDIKATRVSPEHAEVKMYASCTGEELIRVLSDLILSINDTNQNRFKVKNGWWLMLNSEICDKLSERAKKR